ncbi:YIP1 family protein [Candidatus Woesearchaeota archaeon]|nr:YIP1 family protein [Candidatus Woesearchaeota archaeon]
MNLIELVLLSFKDKSRFFDIIRSEPMSHILAYMGVLYIWYAVISIPFLVMKRFFFGFSQIPLSDYLLLLPVSFALVFVFWVFALLIWSGILHAFVSMWGGEGKYMTTLRCVVYGFTPLFVLGPVLYYALLLGAWAYIPLLILYVYTLYVIIDGLSLLHSVRFPVALAAYAIPFISICIWAVYSLWRQGVFGV